MAHLRYFHHYFIRLLLILLAIAAIGLIVLGFMASLERSHPKVVSVAEKPKPKPHQTPKPAHPKPKPAPALVTPLPHDYHLPPIVDGLAPVITSIHTAQPIVFLTIDDGAFKDPSELPMLQDNHLKPSLFLAKMFIQNNPDFFKSFVVAGVPIEDHTLTHDINMVKNMSYARMKAEICGMADYDLQEYGRRPIFFRPPGGAYSTTMQRAAADCGMQAIVTWIAKANGGSMQYQIGDRLRPGDIVLMHFRPEFKQDLQAFIDAQKAAGLRSEQLEEWLVP